MARPLNTSISPFAAVLAADGTEAALGDAGRFPGGVLDVTLQSALR